MVQMSAYVCVAAQVGMRFLGRYVRTSLCQCMLVCFSIWMHVTCVLTFISEYVNVFAFMRLFVHRRCVCMTMYLCVQAL